MISNLRVPIRVTLNSQLILLLLAVANLTQATVTHHKETFDEKLTIWPMKQGFTLLEFDYDFRIDFSEANAKITNIDKFPRQLFDLMRKTDGDVRRIETQ